MKKNKEKRQWKLITDIAKATGLTAVDIVSLPN